MTLSTIYIVRHGYRSNWLPLEQQVAPLTGVESDPPLAPHGVEQAKELAKFFSEVVTERNMPKPQLIFSSPFYRCIETINPTAEALDLQINIDRGVSEWFKPDRAEIPIPLNNAKMNKLFNRVSATMVWPWDTVIPSLAGETEEAVFNRCKLFWKEFFPKFEMMYPNVETIVIVTHAATKIALGMNLMGYTSPRDFLTAKHNGDGETTRLGGSTCSVDAYQLNKDKTWDLVINSETTFLSHGPEMEWHFATSQFEAGSKEDIEYRRQLQKEQDNANSRNARPSRL